MGGLCGWFHKTVYFEIRLHQKFKLFKVQSFFVIIKFNVMIKPKKSSISLSINKVLLVSLSLCLWSQKIHDIFFSFKILFVHHLNIFHYNFAIIMLRVIRERNEKKCTLNSFNHDAKQNTIQTRDNQLADSFICLLTFSFPIHWSNVMAWVGCCMSVIGGFAKNIWFLIKFTFTFNWCQLFILFYAIQSLVLAIVIKWHLINKNSLRILTNDVCISYGCFL